MAIKVAKIGENVRHYEAEGRDTVGRVIERDGFDSTNPPKVKKGGVEVGMNDSVGDGDTLVVTNKSVKGGGGDLGDGILEVDYQTKYEESPKDSIIVSEGITASEFAERVKENLGIENNVIGVRDEDGNNVRMDLTIAPTEEYTVVFEE